MIRIDGENNNLNIRIKSGNCEKRIKFEGEVYIELDKFGSILSIELESARINQQPTP